MSRILNLVYITLLIVLSPLLVYKSWKTGKYREGWSEKFFGLCPERVGRGPCLWLHAVSVGEVRLLKPLVNEVQKRRPDWDIVISSTTETGLSQARQLFPDLLTFYAPMDFTWATRRSLKRIRPTTLALIELELWPNLIRTAKDHGTKICLLNGRLSAKSQKGYSRVRRWIGPILSRMDLVAVQTEEYAQRFGTLGLPKPKLKVTGSIKYDNLETDRFNPATSKIRQLFSIRPDQLIWVAGSTMSGEEQVVLDVYEKLINQSDAPRLILVPRHPERFDEVARMVEERGLPLVRRSQLGTTAIPENLIDAVILVDTLGELSSVWGVADMAFVGGSLLPGRGGQNMMEPAAFGASVYFGSHTSNFKDTVSLLLDRNAASVVTSGENLFETICKDMQDKAGRIARGMRARELVMAQTGATMRTFNELERLMPPESRSNKSFT
jgi:3-deoxy-D-manno-octulosonic-acid transferase